jgi:4-amino-4-deoxy-L-arabinose transferase-like glycosyltransferase
MVQAGDPLHFEFQNQPRYRKPPLAYWVAASGYLLTGEHREAWAGRLFFVLIALGGLGLLASLGGEKTAILFAATFGVTRFVYLAETDLLQLTFMTAAFWSWKRGQGILAGIGMACALLTKGPGGAVIPILSFWILQRWFPKPPRFWIPALLIPLAASAGWIGYLYMDPVASTAMAQDLRDTFLDSAHTNPWPYYVWTFPLVMFPALLYLGYIESEKGSEDRRVAVVWFWVTFVLLTLTVSKQRHYALMLLPPACWWLALHLPSWNPPRKLLASVSGVLILCFAGMYWFGEEGRHTRFLNQIRPLVPETGTLHVVGINSARFDFHLGRHVANTDSLQHALDRALPGEWVVVIDKTDRLPSIGSEWKPRVNLNTGEWVREAYQKP